VTPTTVYGCALTITLRPITFGSELNWRCHSSWERMATRSCPGCSSSGRNQRPSPGSTPSSRKREGETRTVTSSCGSPSPVRLDSPGRVSASSAKLFACSRRSRNSGIEKYSLGSSLPRNWFQMMKIPLASR